MLGVLRRLTPWSRTGASALSQNRAYGSRTRLLMNLSLVILRQDTALNVSQVKKTQFRDPPVGQGHVDQWTGRIAPAEHRDAFEVTPVTVTAQLFV